jgi:ABC-type glycerol-3-phosphate transport system substrate-binding protein
MPAPLPKPATPPVKAADQAQRPAAPVGSPKPLTPSIPVAPARPVESAKQTFGSVAPAAPTSPAAQVNASSGVSPIAPKPAIPTQPITPVQTPSATPTAPTVAPAVVASPTPVVAPTPQVPVQKVAAPPMPQAMPKSVLPPQPLQATPIPQQRARIQTPPQTLTALSSMASNKLPAGAGAVAEQVASVDPKKTGPNVTAAPQAPKKSAEPQFVQPKKSWFKYLPFVGGGILLLLVIGFVAFRFLGLGGSATTSIQNNSGDTTTNRGANPGSGSVATGSKVTLEYWGLWEPTETMASVIKDYEAKNPTVTIKYNKQSHQDYRVRLQNALSSENGPDIFRFHASWVPMLRQQLSALPVSILSPNEYQTTFYPVAVAQLQSNGQIVGIPLMYDGLVLFYNKELFETAVIEPPKTWADLRTVAGQLKLESGTTLTRGGIAMGNATNVEHFSDILALLILQNGGDLSKPSSKEVHDALLFYTNFIKTDEVWSSTLPSSTIAFARGEVAMMFAPSWRAHEVKAMNPDLKFATVPVPQLSDTRIGWATYWAEGVNAKSTKKEESWKFLKFLSSKEIQQKLFADQAKTRAFGELYSRRDLANDLAGDPVASAVIQDAPFAQGWQMSSYTHDDGANDQIVKYYEDAITALNQGDSVEEVQATLTQGVSQVLRQYGIASSTTTAQ